MYFVQWKSSNNSTVHVPNKPVKVEFCFLSWIILAQKSYIPNSSAITVVGDSRHSIASPVSVSDISALTSADSE